MSLNGRQVASVSLLIRATVVIAVSSVLLACGGIVGTAPSKTVRVFANYLFVANSGADTLTVFGIDESSGSLSSVGSIPNGNGNKPRALAVDAFSRYLYVANSANSTISAFSINLATGLGTLIPGSPFPTGTMPIAVDIDPQVRFTYVLNQDSATITMSSVATDGTLMQIASAALDPGMTPQSIVVHPSGKFVYVATNEGMVGFVLASSRSLARMSLQVALNTVNASSMAI